MASGWMKSLQCKSNATNDVVHRHSNPNNNNHSLLYHSHSCRNSVQSIKDIVETTKKPKPKKPKPPKPPFKRPVSRKPEPGSDLQIQTRSIGGESHFSSLAELPKGHPSRNVVEIIFHTSWGEKKDFPGRVEVVLKVQNSARTVARFEEYRDVVKRRASCAAEGDGGEDHARCVADGNEVMGFCSLGDIASSGACETGGGAWTFRGGRRAGLCTYSGSGAAHENGGGGRGRRAMLVCRVVAGRVCKQLKLESLVHGRTGFDSASGENGGLVVLDTRALLPCFLIIYQL